MPIHIDSGCDNCTRMTVYDREPESLHVGRDRSLAFLSSLDSWTTRPEGVTLGNKNTNTSSSCCFCHPGVYVGGRTGWSCSSCRHTPPGCSRGHYCSRASFSCYRCCGGVGGWATAPSPSSGRRSCGTRRRWTGSRCSESKAG